MDMTEKLRRYARVLLAVGCGLKVGDSVVVEVSAEHEAFAQILREEAAAAGATACEIFLTAADHCPVTEEEQTERLHRAEAIAEKKPCMIRLEQAEFADAHADAAAFDAYQKQKLAVRKAIMAKGRAAGTIACVPSKIWADRFYPEMPEEERYDALWETIFACVHCLDEDPVGWWMDYILRTNARKQALDAAGYTEYRYVGEKSDFSFRPVEGSIWMGGCVETPERTFIPNLPTQEIFIGPDRRTVNGHIQAMLPLNFRGHLICDLTLDVKDGRIVSYSASDGMEQLTEMIETEDATHYLGEVAAVEASSPIAAYGKLFYTTLYDENASCHVAIGQGLGMVQDPAERERVGLNTASLHVDFMIGNKTMNIFGRKADGTWQQIFRDGYFVNC